MKEARQSKGGTVGPASRRSREKESSNGTKDGVVSQLIFKLMHYLSFR
jgi:hypothetical protein